MEELIIVGGFCEILELCEISKIEISGIIDSKTSKYVFDKKYLGDDADIEFKINDLKHKLIIITPDLPAIRQSLFNYYNSLGFSFKTLISPLACISKSAVIGNGSIIQSHSNISSEVNIGKFSKINMLANIMHNVKIGNFVTVAPSAVVLGYVEINDNCYIGANSTVLPNIKIAKNVTIGAGAVVTKNITEEGSIYVGVPAKKLNR